MEELTHVCQGYHRKARRTDTNGVGWKQHTLYIQYQIICAKKHIPGHLESLFFVGVEGLNHNILCHTKNISGFSIFFILKEPLSGGESCGII